MRLLTYGVLCLWLYHSNVFAAQPPAYIAAPGPDGDMNYFPVNDDDDGPNIPDRPDDPSAGVSNDIIMPLANNNANLSAKESSDFTSRGPSSLRSQLLQLARMVEKKYKGLALSPLKVHNKLTNTKETPKQNELQNLAQKLSEDGPIEIANDQTRIWMESFYVSGRTKKIRDVSGLTDQNVGVLLGAQVASETEGWVIGAYVGSSKGAIQMDNDKRNKTAQTHKFISLYHSLSLKNGFRYDLIAQYKPSTQNIDRLTTSNEIAKGKKKSAAFHYNAETSYRMKLTQDLSVRPNLGLSMSLDKIKAYDETGGSYQNNHYYENKSRTCEIYGGVGFRHKWKGEEMGENQKDQFIYKLTGVYEIGNEIVSNSPPTRQKMISTGIESKSTTPNPGKLTHYLTFYGSMQYNQLKFLASYILTLKQYRTKHNFGLKAEWRF